MKKTLFFIILIVIIVVSVLYFRGEDDLKSQLLDQQPATAEINEPSICLKLSENIANDCLLKLAIKEGDDSICNKITKGSKQRECEREVGLFK